MEMAIKEVGADKAKGLSNREIFKIDVPANRYAKLFGREESTMSSTKPINTYTNSYDLVCLEGIARAMNTFLSGGPAPKYDVVLPADGKIQQLHIKAEVSST